MLSNGLAVGLRRFDAPSVHQPQSVASGYAQDPLAELGNGDDPDCVHRVLTVAGKQATEFGERRPCAVGQEVLGLSIGAISSEPESPGLADGDVDNTLLPVSQ